MPRLDWIGKDKVENYHDKVVFHTLEKRYTFNSDKESENKIIHADNLIALKSLLPQYEGKIKCIYIDPPYNTGNEGWVYNDNVNDPRIKKWLGEVVGKQGEDLSRDDKWLCMMYPRLKLLQKLLSDDGVIFISIDDNEQANLKLLCDEIFGARNFIGCITRKQSSGAKNDTSNGQVISIVDYLLIYKKQIFEFNPYKVKNNKSFKYYDDLGYFNTRALEMQGGGDTLPERPKMGYSIYHNKFNNDIKLLFDYDLNNNPVYEEPNKELLDKGYECYRPRKREMALGRWRWGYDTFIERFKNNGVYFDKGRVFIKERATEDLDKYPVSLIDEYLNTIGTNEIKQIFGFRAFDFPKPSELLKFIFTVATDKDAIILDSFAGSGTTAHAVLKLNKEDGGNRKFILIEMMDYAENITAERVKRVIKGYKGVEGLECDFSYYELGKPMFKDEENLNEEVGEEKIRQYIYYSETKQPLTREQDKEKKYLLDNYNYTGYYFYYEKDSLTTLSLESFAKIIKDKQESYIIYADICTLSEDVKKKYHIVFKKIPRDIRRF